MRNIKKFLLIAGVFIITCFVVSAATTIPIVQGHNVVKFQGKYNNNENNLFSITNDRIDEITLKLKKLFRSDEIKKIKTIISLKYNIKNYDEIKSYFINYVDYVSNIFKNKRIQRELNFVLEKSYSSNYLGKNNQKIDCYLNNIKLKSDEINNNNLSKFMKILITTILVEFFIYAIFYPSILNLNLRLFAKLFIASFTINIITNPATNFIYQNIYNNTLVLETGVIIVETIMIYTLFNTMFMRISIKESFGLSAIANVLSYFVASLPE